MRPDEAPVEALCGLCSKDQSCRDFLLGASASSIYPLASHLITGSLFPGNFGMIA